MLLPCEIAVKSLVPAIRSVIARELTQTYGLKQKDAATLLGITQTAVSKYITGVRGAIVKIEDVKKVRPIIMETASLLVKGSLSKYELVGRFCVACEIIRRERLMCELCKRSDPSIDVKQCYVCQNGSSSET